MCFSEFIGYTCGHSSAEVLRPCPMTTQLHTNPVCARHARRPVLAPEMCPACQRVLHGRAVLITEWEHRWMHERGACGCEVQFPDLFRPRVAGRENGPGAAGGSTGNGRSNTGAKSNPGAKKTLPRIGGNSKAGAKNVPALYQETLTTTVPGDSKKPEVAVRIPSFYGAEWVDEHRQLHLQGSCKCLGDFSFYKTPANYQVVPPSSVHSRREQVVRMAGSQPFQWRESRNGTMPPYLNPHRVSDKRFSRPANSMHAHLQQVTNNHGNHPSRHGHTNQVSTNQAQLQQRSASQRTHVNLSAPGILGQSFNRGGSTTVPSIPQRSSGAIYEVDPAKSTNQLYNFACGEGAKITNCADFQSVDFPKTEGILPLVGLPIGAGPEGPADLPHTGDFDSCVLHEKDLLSSLGEPCFLRYRSWSVSCLRELKVKRERTKPAARSRSVISSAESSPSQSVDSSAYSSDNEDGLSEENRL